MLATLTGPITASAAPRHAPPTARTRTGDPLPFRVWIDDVQRWACVAAFAGEGDAWLFAKQLTDRNHAVAFQTPEGVERL